CGTHSLRRRVAGGLVHDSVMHHCRDTGELTLDVRDTAQRLNDMVVRRQLGHWTLGAEAADRRVDEPRVHIEESGSPEAESVNHPEPEVLDEHIGLSRQFEGNADIRW